jgi:hypothetical protein
MSIPLYYDDTNCTLAIVLTEEALDCVASNTILGCLFDVSVVQEKRVDKIYLCFPPAENRRTILLNDYTLPLVIHDIIAILTRFRDRFPSGVEETRDSKKIKMFETKWEPLRC